MTISFEEVKQHLPRYLSASSQHELFRDLKEFPNNMDRLYSNYSVADVKIYQGDGIDGFQVINLPDITIRNVPVMILSNTCDIDTENKRFFSSRVVYAPILQLEKYKVMLYEELVANSECKAEDIEGHIRMIKKQLVTQVLYLPKGYGIETDCVVFLDRLNNYPLDHISLEGLTKRRLFSLSNYGLYVFLIKLSIHFTRIRENIDRTLH